MSSPLQRVYSGEQKKSEEDWGNRYRESTSSFPQRTNEKATEKVRAGWAFTALL